MASLIIQDTFEPYYAGRDDDAERRPTKPPAPSRKQPERRREGEIVLPGPAPAPAGKVRRERHAVAH